MERFLFLSLLLIGCPGKDDEEEEDEEAQDDSDTGTDDSGGGDSDSGSGNGPATYEAFVTEHVAAYCGAMETCGFLDEEGFADTQECIDRLTAAYTRGGCNGYDAAIAGECLAADVDLRQSCTANGIPPICNRVCQRPDSG